VATTQILKNGSQITLVGELRHIFTGEVIVDPFKIDTKFSEALAPDVVRTVSEFGLQDEMIGVLSMHLSRLHVVMVPENSTERSHLSLFRSPETDEYKRLAMVSPEDIAQRSDLIRDIASEQSVRIDRRQGDMLGLDWVYYELSVDALSNSVYMQNRFERYVNDTNVQDGFDSNLYIARNFLNSISSDGPALTDVQVKNQQTRFKQGMALQMLPDAAVRTGITSDLKKATWLVHGVQGRYPTRCTKGEIETEPLSMQEMSAMFESIEVRPGLQDAFDYAVKYPYTDLDEIEEYFEGPSTGIIFPNTP
jgi:hypothetical protein